MSDLKIRLEYPEIIDFVKHFDILCFSETKTETADEINLPNYTFIAKHRHSFANHKSGGVIWGFKRLPF